jgi:hypothetical protein
MSHIWRKLLATENHSEKYDIVKQEIKDLYRYSQSEVKAKNYDEGAKALSLAVHLFHQLIVDNPSHPRKIADMREALTMLQEKILLDGFLKRREIHKMLSYEPTPEVHVPQPSHIEMPNAEMQETYAKFKKMIKFPTGNFL